MKNNQKNYYYKENQNNQNFKTMFQEKNPKQRKRYRDKGIESLCSELETKSK